jgi:SAM-dependent methyltransferase
MSYNVNMRGYRADLAYIHDVGFSDYARKAAPGLLRILSTCGVKEGLVVDLGCGGGHWARELNRAGYRVLGVDQSPSMIRLARRKAPKSKFRVASFLTVGLPPCDGITSIGECLNYRFDERDSRDALVRLFERAYRALRSGGVFIFDVAGPTRFRKKTPQEIWRTGRDWAVLVSSAVDGEKKTLCRRITAFRKVGKLYRRSEEIHYLQLYRPSDLVAALAHCGFDARTLRGYGRFRFPTGITGILAVKP